jgi:hypothetical protein
MDLIRKVRVLVGALVHQPLAARPEKVEPEEAPPARPEAAARRDRGGLEERQATTADTERVADLIARQRQKEGG